MHHRLAKVVTDHPQTTTFFVTLVGNLIFLVVDVFFSLSVIRFAQEWMAVTREVNVFHVSLISAFRYQTWPWGVKDFKEITSRSRWLPAVLVAVCVSAFAFVPSGTTSLLGPAPFLKTVPLTGTELDFSSTASECVGFLNTNLITNNCDWQVSDTSRTLEDWLIMNACLLQFYKDTPYTNCLGENQMVDVLEAGRGNVGGKFNRIVRFVS